MQQQLVSYIYVHRVLYVSSGDFQEECLENKKIEPHELHSVTNEWLPRSKKQTITIYGNIAFASILREFDIMLRRIKIFQNKYLEQQYRQMKILFFSNLKIFRIFIFL